MNSPFADMQLKKMSKDAQKKARSGTQTTYFMQPLPPLPTMYPVSSNPDFDE